MATSRIKKEEMLSELTEIFKTAKGAVFADYRGLSVKEIESLRKSLREQGATLKVAKLTLVRKAMQDAGMTAQLDAEVPTALIYSSEDEVTAAKVVAKFISDTKKLAIVSGILSGKVLDAGEVKNLASLPGKQELRGQVVSVIAGPMRGMVGVLSGVQRSFVYALNAIAQQKS